MMHNVGVIRQVFSYMGRFKNSRFVVCLDGDVVDTPLFSGLIRDLALLHQSGIKCVVVAGASSRIDQIFDQYGMEKKRHKGIRISPTISMPFIKMAAFDVTNRVMTLFARNGITGVVGNWVKARNLGVIEGIDYEDSGEVSSIHSDDIISVMEQGMVPILPCIGWSGTGKPYNVSSLELASRLAESLNAEKLFMLTSGEGFHEASTLVNNKNSVSLQDLSTKKLNPLLQNAYNTCEKGVERVHILNSTLDGTILQEIFSNQGAGIMIYASGYENIRPMQHTDAPDIMRIMEPYIQDGILVRRTEESLLQDRERYVVFELDNSVHGCGSLVEYVDQGTAEIAGIAVNRELTSFKVGKKIVQYLIEKARDKGLQSVFVLTTRTADWFEELGFTKNEKFELPKGRDYDKKRKSHVLFLEL